MFFTRPSSLLFPLFAFLLTLQLLSLSVSALPMPEAAPAPVADPFALPAANPNPTTLLGRIYHPAANIAHSSSAQAQRAEDISDVLLNRAERFQRRMTTERANRRELVSAGAQSV